MCCKLSALSIPCFQILKLLCLTNHHPYTSALHCFSSSLLSLLNANRHSGSPLPYHEIENIVNHAAKSSSYESCSYRFLVGFHCNIHPG
ncbi:Uncharacterized protein APZ42_028496 [Daphnia magna]|uniref:Uncharacterized protein n=1 Tax=Daphnia magna TaxID=35525 RepID=A0A164QGG0_9CRUS|nr:Uncharacterized protein APZ42_028496 [Daphnia magna]